MNQPALSELEKMIWHASDAAIMKTCERPKKLHVSPSFKRLLLMETQKVCGAVWRKGKPTDGGHTEYAGHALIPDLNTTTFACMARVE